MKIAVFGLGGVGGALGGALAKVFPEDITFIARGERKKYIEEHGLTVEGDFLGSFTARPALVTDRPEEAGVQDAVIISVKNPALAKTAEGIAPMVGKDTLLIAVMNGIEAGEVLRKVYPENPTTQASIYIIAQKGPDFSVIQKGRFTDITFAGFGGNSKAAKLAEMFGRAGITAHLAEDMEKIVWEKYIFNCAYNTMTAALGVKAESLKQEPALSDFAAIIREGVAAAAAKGIVFEGMEEQSVNRLLHTKGSSDSSLSRDVDNGEEGELEMFSGDLVRLAEAAGVKTPVLAKYYELAKERLTRVRKELELN